ncbi:MAG: MgtC/SapB family protein [Alphaproteobacteria bacterium]|nr:MgtC/SapB family protein [Alphaproteobacteria bacterium]
MTTIELLQRLATALAVGFLVGVERGWQERQGAPGSRAAGVRTFALVGLFGGLCGALYPLIGPFAFGMIALGFAAGFIVFQWRQSTARNNVSATELVAGLLTFALGTYAVLGQPIVAGAAGVVITAILATRHWLHDFVARITWIELRSAILLLAMSVVILPVLPNRFVDPWQLFNPHQIWLMTVLIAAASFAGYVAVKAIGPAQGLIVAGAAGGLVSSAAVTYANARQASSADIPGDALTNGIIAAWIVSYIRVTVIAVVVAPELLARLGVPIAAACLAAALVGVLLHRRRAGRSPAKGIAIKNPFDFFEVLRFAAILSAVMAAVKMLSARFGEAGLLSLAAIAGVVERDAVAVSAGSMVAREGIGNATLAVLVALAADVAGKLALATVISRGRLAGRLATAAAAMLVAGGGTYAMMRPG